MVILPLLTLWHSSATEGAGCDFSLVVLLVLRLNQPDSARVNAVRDQGKKAEQIVRAANEQNGCEVQLFDVVENLHIATSPHAGEMPLLTNCQVGRLPRPLRGRGVERAEARTVAIMVDSLMRIRNDENPVSDRVFEHTNPQQVEY